MKIKTKKRIKMKIIRIKKKKKKKTKMKLLQYLKVFKKKIIKLFYQFMQNQAQKKKEYV